MAEEEIPRRRRPMVEDIRIVDWDPNPQRPENLHQRLGSAGLPLVVCVDLTDLDAAEAKKRIQDTRRALGELADRLGAPAPPTLIAFGKPMPDFEDPPEDLLDEGVPLFRDCDEEGIRETIKRFVSGAPAIPQNAGEPPAGEHPQAGPEEGLPIREKDYADVLNALQPKDWREREY
jgi:hypothetical protein